MIIPLAVSSVFSRRGVDNGYNWAIIQAAAIAVQWPSTSCPYAAAVAGTAAWFTVRYPRKDTRYGHGQDVDGHCTAIAAA